MNKSAFLVSTAIGLTMAVSGPAFALNKLPHNGKLKDPYRLQHLPGAPAKPQKNFQPRHRDGLKEVYVKDTWSASTTSLFGGFSVVETATLPCKTACTIIVNAVVQEGSYYSYNMISLCPAIDGYFMNGSCPFGGPTAYGHAPSGGYVPVPILANISVGTGTHQAEFYAYTVAPAYLGGYQIDYHVYK